MAGSSDGKASVSVAKAIMARRVVENFMVKVNVGEEMTEKLEDGKSQNGGGSEAEKLACWGIFY
jgi:hypothetical protein